MPKSLRPEYQKPTVDDLLQNYESSRPTRDPLKKNMLVELPTGSGKTLVSSSFVIELLENGHISTGRPVLFIAPGRQLVDQAAKTFAAQLDVSERQACILIRSHVGDPSSNEPALTLYGRDRGSALMHLYTLQGFLSDLRNGSAELQALLTSTVLLVWDECHFGASAGASFAREIKRLCKARPELKVLGLTATRVAACDALFPPSTVKYEFEDILRMGFLAQPLSERVDTQVSWTPELSSTGDFSRSSLGKLARSEARCQVIVDRFCANRDRYKKVLIFACDQKHVKLLLKMMLAKGIAAVAVWSGRDKRSNDRAISRFRTGSAQVLINVDMMSQGVDIPDIMTVFLCRPTRSRAKLLQMIGRGSRIHGGQDTFFLVDFVDSVDSDAKPLVAADLVRGASMPGRRRTSRYARRDGGSALEFRPEVEPRCIGREDGLPEALQGLWIHEGQSFGVELELATAQPPGGRGWDRRVFRPLQRALVAALRAVPGRVHPVTTDAPDYSSWLVEYDGSVGLEIVSPKLAGIAGLRELAAIADGVSEWLKTQPDVGINALAGVHVHLGWKSDADTLRALLGQWHALEPALGTVVAPSRLTHFALDTGEYDLETPNEYCQPLSAVLTRGTVEDYLNEQGGVVGDLDRYTTLNIANLAPDGTQTVEVRMHSGTTDTRKLIPWISFLQGLLWAVRSNPAQAPALPRRPRAVIEPSGDICRFVASTFDFVDTIPLQRMLHQRRLEVLRLWQQHPDLSPWERYATSWQAPTEPLGLGSSSVDWLQGPVRAWIGLTLRNTATRQQLQAWAPGSASTVEASIGSLLDELSRGAPNVSSVHLRELCRALGVRPPGTKADMVSAIAHKALSKSDPSRQALTSWIDASVRRSELLTVCCRAGLDVKSRESKRSMLNRLTQLQHLRVLDACRLSELRRLARRESLRTSGTRVEVITELVFGLHNGWAPVAGLRA